MPDQPRVANGAHVPKRCEMNTMRVVRLSDEPIIRPHMDKRMGVNINGPSLIRVPDWIGEPLGRYYLYFADHKGAYIRLACADALAGPWRIHTPGTLALEASHFATERPDPAAVSEGTRREAVGSIEQDYLHPHIASPDVHVDHDRREIRMYYHGMLEDGEQRTRVAVSHGRDRFRGPPGNPRQLVLSRVPARGMALRAGDAGRAAPLARRSHPLRVGSGAVLSRDAPCGGAVQRRRARRLLVESRATRRSASSTRASGSKATGPSGARRTPAWCWSRDSTGKESA